MKKLMVEKWAAKEMVVRGEEDRSIVRLLSDGLEVRRKTRRKRWTERRKEKKSQSIFIKGLGLFFFIFIFLLLTSILKSFEIQIVFYRFIVIILNRFYTPTTPPLRTIAFLVTDRSCTTRKRFFSYSLALFFLFCLPLLRTLSKFSLLFPLWRIRNEAIVERVVEGERVLS